MTCIMVHHRRQQCDRRRHHKLGRSQASSSVNDSARGDGGGRQFPRDIAGAITTGGTATAYTVTSDQAFNSLANMSGKMVAFVPTDQRRDSHLNVDRLGAEPLRAAPATELLAGVLVQGTPYVAIQQCRQRVAAPALRQPLQRSARRHAGVHRHHRPQFELVLPFGQAISRATYAAYFAMVGTTYGAGDGSTTSTSSTSAAASPPARTTGRFGGERSARDPFRDQRGGARRGRRFGKPHAHDGADAVAHPHGRHVERRRPYPHRDRCVPDWRQPG